MSRSATKSKRVKALPASGGAAKGNGSRVRRPSAARTPRPVERSFADAHPAPRDGDRSLRLAAEWYAIRGEVALYYGAACSRIQERAAAGGPAEGPPTGPKLHDLLARLERAERRLVDEAPRSLGGVVEYLEIAEEILTERRTDPEGPMGAGPALEILCNARKALRLLEDDEAGLEADRAA